MMLPRAPLLTAAMSLLVLGTSGLALAATYTDPTGDVNGAGPDVVAVTVSNTASSVSFRVRFASAPPLRVSSRGKWVDMLLIGIDVPPLGPPPSTPGGEWRGADYALGTHGPSAIGQLVRLGTKATSPPIRFRIVADGRTLRFSIPRRALGSPRWFKFSVAAAREGESRGGGVGFDVAPARGTLRYELS